MIPWLLLPGGNPLKEGMSYEPGCALSVLRDCTAVIMGFCKQIGLSDLGLNTDYLETKSGRFSFLPRIKSCHVLMLRFTLLLDVVLRTGYLPSFIHPFEAGCCQEQRVCFACSQLGIGTVSCHCLTVMTCL